MDKRSKYNLFAKSNLLFYVILIIVGLFLNISNLFAYNIVAIKSKDVAPYNQALDGFKTYQNANIIEYTINTGLKNKVLFKKIIADQPKLILTIGLNATTQAKKFINDIPVIYCMVINPEKHDLINKTGKHKFLGIGLRISVTSQLNTLKEVLPFVKTLGVVYNPANSKNLIRSSSKVLKNMGIELISKKVTSGKDVPRAIRAIISKIDALWLIADATVVTKESFNFLILTTIEKRLPVMAHSERFVQAGALFSVAPSYYGIGKLAAEYAKKIIDDENLSIPLFIEPEIPNLTINLKTAKKIGIDISEKIKKSAQKIFK